ASGAYNNQWREFGSWLVSQGRADSIVRLAWEFNGDWFAWSVKNDPANWVPCFRQVVSSIRSTDPQARIDWTINAHSPNAFEYYPGDEYVYIIGIDTYDHWPASLDDASWNRQCNQATGLCSMIRFARERGKQFSVAEWGLVATSDTGAGRAGQAGGDNPFFIQKMCETFVANADVLAYEAYYNNAEEDNVRSSLVAPVINPRSAEKYLDFYGADASASD
nr:glycosyl hydrolase [Micromonospora sp. DSM 115978]